MWCYGKPAFEACDPGMVVLRNLKHPRNHDSPWTLSCATGIVRVVRSGRRNEDLPPENLLIKWQVTLAADSRCQPVNRVFAVTPTNQALLWNAHAS